MVLGVVVIDFGLIFVCLLLFNLTEEAIKDYQCACTLNLSKWQVLIKLILNQAYNIYPAKAYYVK